MTDPPPMRKSASKSPPILPAHLTPPRPLPTSAAPPPPSSTSQEHRNISSSDIGVLKLSAQVSQNDDRLPPTVATATQASLGSGSESGSSGPLDGSIPQLPFLDNSPAGPANSSQNQPIQSQEMMHHRQRAFAYVADSQSVDALSFPDMSTHPGPAVLGETSFSHNSDNSMNISLDRSSTLSINSGSSGSHRSGSQAGHSSGNSRSSGSQAESQSYSDISFTNVETSTPRLTPNQQTSQLSTPSDGEQHLLSLPLSPTSRYSVLQQSPENHSRSGGAGGSMDHSVRSAIGLPGPSPPLTGRKFTKVLDRTEEEEEEDEEEISLGQRVLDDMPTQILEQFNPDLQELPVDEEGSSAQPAQLTDDDDEDGVGNGEMDLAGLEELNSQNIQKTVGSTPSISRLMETKTTTTKPTRTTSTMAASTSSSSSSQRVALASTGKQEPPEKEEEVYDELDLDDYYTSDEDDDSNRSNTTTDVGIDLQLSQSEANIEETLLPRSRQASTAMPQLSAPSSSTSVTSSHATAVTTSVNKAGVQTATAETQTDQNIDLARNVSNSRSRTPTPPIRVGSAISLSDSPTERIKRFMKEPRRPGGSPGSQEHSSSQNDPRSPSSAPSSFIQRLAKAQQEDDNTSDEELEGSMRPILSKRRRVGAEASTKTRAPSSAEGEAEMQFWLGLENAEPATSGKARKGKSHHGKDDSEDEEKRRRKSRSRSGSQDISSFPDEGLSELDIAPFWDGSQQAEGEEGNGTEALEPTGHGPSTPPSASLTLSLMRRSRRHTGSPPPEPPRVSPKRVPPRQLRRTTSATNLARGSQSSQTPSQTSSNAPARVSLRRMQSTVDASRVYKTDDPVWARWRKSYYAGKVVRKNNQLYDIHFLDEDVASCENTQMRPFKLKLGANVMGKKTESMDYEAAVEGIQMSSVFAQSRVDVRFKDDTEANLSLNQISLTAEMMAQLDKEVNWDSDDSSAGAGAGAGAGTGPSVKGTRAGKRASSSQARRETSFFESQTGPSYSQTGDLFSTQQTNSRTGTPVPTTPTKGKNSRLMAAQKSFVAPSTPTRRSKGSGQSLGLSTPVRRAKDLFKDVRFVLSLTGPGGSTDLVREMSSKIKAGGGTIIDDYTSLMDPAQGVNLTNVFLISITFSRTVKYISALALNVPRLSYRWVDACIESRQLLPHQSYHLPTGFSNELETIVSSSSCSPTGLFDGLTIGLCGGVSIRNAWERNLLAAGAKETKMVNAKTGATNCNYIVFFNIKAYNSFIDSNKHVPSLCDEWLVQCLINQRIVTIHGHPSYTDLEKKSSPVQQQQRQPSTQQRPHSNTQHSS